MKARKCRLCSVDISQRHPIATLCFDCLYSRGKRTGQSKAASEVAKAIRLGHLSRANTNACIDCSSPAEVYDHRDYNKPLVVDPVCKSCNSRRGSAIHLKKEEA